MTHCVINNDTGFSPQVNARKDLTVWADRRKILAFPWKWEHSKSIQALN